MTEIGTVDSIKEIENEIFDMESNFQHVTNINRKELCLKRIESLIVIKEINKQLMLIEA